VFIVFILLKRASSILSFSF